MEHTPPSPDDLLAQLQAEGNAPAPAVDPRAETHDAVSESSSVIYRRVIARAEAGRGGRGGLARIRYSHEDCIDRMLMTPGISQKELAQLYGVTETWMSIVVNCDAFKARLADRREELIDPALLASLNERYGALASRSVEVLLEKLAQPIEKISDKLALEAASLGAKAVGLGQPTIGSGVGNASDHLAAIAHRLMDLNRPLGQVVEAEPRQVH